MAKTYAELKYEEFCNKFQRFFLNKKKVRALINFAIASQCDALKLVKMIKELMKMGFLDAKEEEFLDYEIHKLAIDALTWAHKTPWVKERMAEMRSRRKKRDERQLFFPVDYFQPRAPENFFPLAMIAKATSTQAVRI